MNWYKIAQVIIDPNMHNKGYMDIGHDTDTESQLWIWDRGKLFTDEGIFDHSWLTRKLREQSLLESDWAEEPGTRFHGRFDIIDGQKRVGIKPCTTLSIRGIPNSLIRDLVSEFGKDIEIYTF